MSGKFGCFRFLRFNSIRRTDYVDRETAEGADTFASSRTDPAC